MNSNFLTRFFPSWTRNKDGDNFYDITSITEWYNAASNLEIALEHPILTPALLFISKLYAQAEFKIFNSSKKEIKSHWVLNLLNNPNQYQTGADFLESLMFTMIANGTGVVYKRKPLGSIEVKELHILDFNLLVFPHNFDKLTSIKSDHKNVKLKYDVSGEDLEIKLSDLMFFYDLPNAIYSKNKYKSKSRITGLKQTLINTHDSLTAKNIILKSNGKELITGKKGGYPLSPEEKEEAQSLFNRNYGLSKTRSRSLITKADLTWKSLHIALRDLGLDESVKVDGNIIYTALHIPKDILSLEAKKTTYNNFKESMVSYVQNEMQTSLDAFTGVICKSLLADDPELKLVGDYEHLPIMQFILIERYEGVMKRAQALRELREVGVPDEMALEMCGMDIHTKLGPVVQRTGKNEKEQEQEQSESKLRKIN